MVKHNVHASVKDEKLVALRREQMIKGAVQLFKQKVSAYNNERDCKGSWI